MSDEMKRHPAIRITVSMLILIYTGACIFLYVKFMGWTSGSVYESDLPAHISLAVDDGLIYSLISFILIGLSRLHLMGILPFILGLFAFLSVFFTQKLLMEVTDRRLNPDLAALAALFLNLVMPCYIKGLADGRYMGMHTSSIWHNSTYLMMKWMGLWTILIYLKLERDISEKLTLKSYIYFTVVMTLTTAAKPNFFLAVAPVMFVFLIIDMIGKKAPLGRLILFASSVLPSFIVMLLQNSTLFAESSSSGGIVIAPGKAMAAHTGYLIPVSILSIAFPLMVLILHVKELFKNRYMLFAWMSAAVGFLQYFLFMEDGARALDANLSWGYAFTIILIFGISLLQWITDVRKFLTGKRETCMGSVSADDKIGAGSEMSAVSSKKDIFMKAYLIACGAVLVWHAYCGILFFVRLLCGVSYMMWG